MKKLLAAIALLVSLSAYSQQYLSLNDALKNPGKAYEIIVQPNESRQVKKLANRIDRFDNLQTVYIQRGISAANLQILAAALKDKELGEVVVECDTLTQLVETIATLQATDKITLIEPFSMKPKALLDIATLNCASLGLTSSTRIKIPKGFAFPAHLEEVSLLSKQPSKNYLLVDKLAGLEKLTSVYITTENLAALPAGLGNITSLKNLEIIKASELSKENELMSQRFRMGKEANECHQLVTITYNTATEMGTEEKQAFAGIFNGFYFITDKEKPKNPAPLTVENIARNEVFEQTVGFKPLTENVDVKRKVFTFTPETPVQINVSSGTTISIPKDAFTDGDGNPVTGDINVTYREIKTPLAMLMSGVPMAYDSGGVTNQFVSAGNFEILAFKDGQPLQLAAGKTITVDFISTDVQPGYNLYKLNAETRNWEFTGGADNNQKIRDTTGDKPFVIKDQSIEYDFDTTRHQYRFASMDHSYALDANIKEGRVLEVNKKRNGWYMHSVSNTVRTKTALLALKIVYTEREKKDSARQVKFTIGSKVKKDNGYHYFPELTAFRGYTFYTDKETTRKLFKQSYIRKQKYNDVRVLYEPGDDYCTLQLKGETGIVELTADITQGENDLKALYRKKSFARRYKRYTRSLDKRIARLNNGLEQRMRKSWERFNETAYMRGPLLRSLTLNGLGTYNCDAFYRFPNRPSVLTNVVVTTAADSDPIYPVTLFVVDERINGVLTYSAFSVSLYKQYTKTIVAIDYDNNIYTLEGKATDAITNNTIRMKKLDPASFDTERQFANLVGL